MHRLTSQVQNVCFKFTRQDRQAIRHLQDVLLKYEIAFKICTILLPFSFITRANLQPQVDDFARMFSLDVCIVHSLNAQTSYGTVDEAYQHSVNEWVHIVD